MDAAFLPISSDLEWATGLRRGIPNFGEVHQAHDWAMGCFLRPDHDPIFVVHANVRGVRPGGRVPGELIVIKETDDGEAVFRKLVSQLGRVGTLAVGARAWADTVIHLMDALGSPKLVSAELIVNRLRQIKEPVDLEVMTRAAGIADRTMAAVTPPGAAGRHDE